MSYSRNLLEETFDAITDYTEQSVARVDWVGSADGEYAIDWDEFASISQFYYDSGFGSQEVAPDLVVVFTDGTWLERSEYDGAESWEYKRAPRRSTHAKAFERIKVENYEGSLAKLNEVTE